MKVGLTRLHSNQHGWFYTGMPVRFRFMRNVVPAPDMGSKYGQDIEPAGTYLLEDTCRAWEHPVVDPSGRNEWIFGWARFEHPLVLLFTTEPDLPHYGPDGWKARLVKCYEGLTGTDLTAALRADGYDGVVTVWLSPTGSGHTKEIVDLTFGEALELDA